MKAFFRIDDVGNWDIDRKILPSLIDSLAKNGIPACLQVIPRQLSGESVDYLNHLHRNFPGMSEIGQHGYTHDLQEFTWGRTYNQQLIALRNGRDVLWRATGSPPEIFTPPEHIYTPETIRALDSLGYKIFSRQVKPSWDARIFYGIGHRLQRLFLFGKKVSYHGRAIPKTHLEEISIAIELTRNRRVKTVEEVKREVDQCIKMKIFPVGFLIHHECIQETGERRKADIVIEYIGRSGLAFSTMAGLQINGTGGKVN
jgi:hypothetical protein